MTEQDWRDLADAVGTLARLKDQLPGRLPRFVGEALRTIHYGLRESIDVDADRDRYTLVGCPRCGAPPDHYCVTATGNVYDDSNGPLYFHAARRRAVDDLEVADA